MTSSKTSPSTFSLTRFLGPDSNLWPGPNPLHKKKKKKKKRKKKLWPSWIFDYDQKIKIFKTDLSHSVFRVHSDFGIHFFTWDSKIVQTVQFPKGWLLHKSWPKVKIFKKDLCCSVFQVDSDFGVYFFIWESKIAQIVWFYSCWLWCELWPRIKMSEQSLSHLVFHEDSDFEVCLFV